MQSLCLTVSYNPETTIHHIQLIPAGALSTCFTPPRPFRKIQPSGDSSLLSLPSIIKYFLSAVRTSSTFTATTQLGLSCRRKTSIPYNMNPLRLGTIVPNQQRYNEHKDAYRRQRNHFRSNPRALLELEAWRKCDNNYDYQLLNQGGKAFVPASLVGGGLSGYTPWAKADTFFSEYALHYPSSLILSESDHSYIIGNKASYDGRQYPLALTEKRPEGQGYCHTLVIPKTRIYNVVDPLATENHCFVLKELRDHFFKFWSNEINRDAVLARARKALEERESALVHKGPRHPQYTQSVSNAVFSDFERMKSVFRLLKAEDFVLGFHVFPENSIGHLHMHVFPHDNYFREHSTKDYDYKTVPLQAILDVEEEDEATSAEELVDLTADSSSSDGKVPLNGELPSNAEVPSNTEVPSNAFVAVNKSG